MDADIRLVAIDIDGTLVDSEGQVSAVTRQAVQRVRDAGITVLIATGRRYLTARPAAAQLETDVLIAAHNGALLKDMQGQVLQALELGQYRAQQAAAALLNMGYDPLVFQGTQDAASIWINRSSEIAADGWFRSYLERNAPHLHIADSLADATFGDVLEVVSVIPKAELAETMTSLENELGEDVRLICQVPPHDTRAFLEIANPQVSKAAPLRFLTDQLGITAAQIMAFGDNYNDLDMLEYAGVAYLMDNAPDDLKQRGYAIAPSNDQDGVAAVLMRTGQP